MPNQLKVLVAFALLLIACLGERCFAEPLLISETGSERATTGPGNNIITHAGKTHVVWQDSDAKGYWDKVRTFDHESKSWSPTVTLGPGKDNHTRPCITIDSKGFLHVVIGGHNTMMSYYRSEKPNDSSAWTKAQPVAEGTYPMIVCGPDDTLALGGRVKNGDGVSLWVLPPGAKKWEARDLVFRRNKIYSGYAGYNVALAWGPDGSLHLAADVYEGRGYDEHRGVHQAMIYMVSRDVGKTWTKADGTALPEHVYSENADVLARLNKGVTGPAQGALIRNGGVAVDSKGKVHLYFTESKDGVDFPRLVVAEGTNGWRDLPLKDAVKNKWPNLRVPGARGHFTLGPDDTIYVLVELHAIPEKGAKVEKYESRAGIGLMTSHDGGATFEARELVPFNAGARVGQASLERQTGHNDLKGRLPSLIYAEGLQRYPDKETAEVIDTKVYWLQP